MKRHKGEMGRQWTGSEMGKKIKENGYTEVVPLTKTIVIKFQCGLDLALQNQVALLGDGTLDFGDLEGSYEAARRVFQSKEAKKAFIETNRGVTCNHAPTPPATNFGGVFVLTCKVFLTALMQSPIP